VSCFGVDFDRAHAGREAPARCIEGQGLDAAQAKRRDPEFRTKRRTAAPERCEAKLGWSGFAGIPNTTVRHHQPHVEAAQSRDTSPGRHPGNSLL
jgi:hypothetical protein